MDFSGGLILPVPTVLKRPIKCDSPGTWTIIDTATAIPAFFRVQGNRRFAFLRMGYIDIYLADLYTMVAPITDIRVEYYRIVRCRNIRNSEYFFLRHFSLQK
jgi:hypothetical protein